MCDIFPKDVWSKNDNKKLNWKVILFIDYLKSLNKLFIDSVDFLDHLDSVDYLDFVDSSIMLLSYLMDFVREINRFFFEKFLIK